MNRDLFLLNGPQNLQKRALCNRKREAILIPLNESMGIRIVANEPFRAVLFSKAFTPWVYDEDLYD